MERGSVDRPNSRHRLVSSLGSDRGKVMLRGGGGVLVVVERAGGMRGTVPVAHYDGIVSVACGLPLVITSRWIIGLGTSVLDLWRRPRKVLEQEEWNKECYGVHVYSIPGECFLEQVGIGSHSRRS